MMMVTDDDLHGDERHGITRSNCWVGQCS